MPSFRLLTGLTLAASLSCTCLLTGEDHPGYQDTPIIPGTTWHVHDSKRPLPAVVVPGTFPSQQDPGKPPSDAIVLFDGKDTSHWKQAWPVENGYMITDGGDNESKDVFGDIQLHVEWAEPTPPTSESQGRGNSGVFMMGRYEIQVLDSYKNPTYPDGQCGSVYGQTPPLVNSCRAPGEWQTYDIMWTAPRFEDNKLVSPAYVTVIQNGVLIQNHTKVTGETPHRQIGTYSPHGDDPVKLQYHGNKVRYRSVWVRKLKPIDSE